MFNFLLKILGVPELLKQAHAQGKKEGIAEYKEQEAMNKIMVNFPVGTEVMHLSGQSPIQRAVVVGHEKIHSSWHLILQNAQGEKFMTGGRVLRFEENRWNSFQKLQWWEQHNVGTDWGPSFNLQKAMNLQSGRPAWDNGDGQENEE